MENPPFWWYLTGMIRIVHGYVSLPEGNKTKQFYNSFFWNLEALFPGLGCCRFRRVLPEMLGRWAWFLCAKGWLTQVFNQRKSSWTCCKLGIFDVTTCPTVQVFIFLLTTTPVGVCEFHLPCSWRSQLVHAVDIWITNNKKSMGGFR